MTRIKKTIQLVVTQRETIDVEVEFPIYRHHFNDYWDSYTRIDADGQAYAIAHAYGRDQNEWTIEVTRKYVYDHSAADYHLGKGMHTLSEEDFYKALEDMLKEVEKIPQDRGTK